jgi:hypothetical protein
MTPFERAEKAVAEIEEGEFSERAIIESAIRAAENDALERAAVHCDEQAAEADRRADRSLDPVEDGYSSAYQEAAAFARSLKHN